jgi:4-hydroxy-2-oxoheptanedioate aldolase
MANERRSGANPVKEKLRRGEAVLGAFLGFHAPVLVEALGLAGLDFVVLDAEHGPLAVDQCEHLIRAAECTGLAPLVRLHAAARPAIGQYLDVGALGVQVPMVNDVAGARAVVAAAKYPPLGQRGLGACRAVNLGTAGRSMAEYATDANAQTLLVVQIETVEAVGRAEAIAATPEVDVVFLGPTDLSTSLGAPGSVDTPAFHDAEAQIRKAVLAAGKGLGTVAPNAQTVARLKDQGYTYFVGSVNGLMNAALRAFVSSVKGVLG